MYHYKLVDHYILAVLHKIKSIYIIRLKLEPPRQLEYVALCEQTYPTIMEKMLIDEQRERLFKRKRKSG